MTRSKYRVDVGKIDEPELLPETTFKELDFPELATVETMALGCCGLV